MPQIPAGWYPDPAPPQPGQPPFVRYWDGRVWTPHVTLAAVPGQVPVPQQATPSTAAPYAPAVSTGSGAGRTGESPAGWWWRVLAYVIDGFVINVLGSIASIPAQLAFQDDVTDLAEDFQAESDALPPDVAPDFAGFFGDLADLVADNAVGLLLPSLLVVTTYHALMLRWKGATLGKLAVGLRVRRLAGQEGDGLPWANVLLRITAQFLLPVGILLASLLSGSLALFLAVAVAYGIYLALDLLWPLWDPRNQALHDKVARTQVVKLS